MDGLVPGFRWLEPMVFLVFALPLSIVDAKTYRLPDVLVFGGLVALLATKFFVSSTTLAASVVAALIATAFFFALKKIIGGLGLGDVKYAALVGLFVGLRGLSPALFCSAISALIFIAASHLVKGRSIHQKIPFGPFMTIGAVASFILVSLALF